ncbi:MAG TPA: PQQ-binding-like beta-propeller repeat protein [Aggregatilineales bacterium]|nr:PQQ-binding-like beta-propeller repeat protein [Aggregatilineales bacterium]
MPWRWIALGLLIFLVIGLVGSPRSASAGSPEDAGWPMWGHDLSNHRYNDAETTLTADTVRRLTLKWTFAFPNTYIASSQPTVIGDTVYVGGWNGYIYALDSRSGRERWSFFTGITGKVAVVRVGVVVRHGLVLFGDQLGRFFAVNESNGSLVWSRALDSHSLAQITGSPMVYGDRVYVPMASREENASADASYPCCTFRGSLSALNIADGTVAWRFYTAGEAHPLSQTEPNGPVSGPSGAGIWSTPAIDPEEKLIYVTTGNSYSPPVSPYSDAFLALNLDDGSLRWASQLTTTDWANSGCNGPVLHNCTESHGNDEDFGAAPLLFTIQTPTGSRKLVGATQKNGTFYALDALTGAVVWQRSVGESTSYNWGSAYDGRRLYVGDATDTKNGGVYALDPATGAVLWSTGPMPCHPDRDQRPEDCWSGHMDAAIATPGLVWIGAMDGQVRALSGATGDVLWTYNTNQIGLADNGVRGHGGSIGPAGVTVASGQVYVMSGYNAWGPRLLSGNVLFVFGLDETF